MAELVLKDEVYEIIGAAMEVYWQLGRGFLEPIYQEAFEIELARRGLPFEPQKELTIVYKGHTLEKKYVADMICFNQIIVELKALHRLTGVDEGQLLNYMRMTRMGVGLLINFGSQVRLEWKRYVI
jgi:GxxExxY protein